MTTSSPHLHLNTGHTMPALGFGTYMVPAESTAGAVATAIESGYRLIDGAAAYGNEQQLGEGIRQAGSDGSDLFVTTKLWIDDYGYEAALRGSGQASRNWGSTTSTSICCTGPLRRSSLTPSHHSRR